MKTEINKHYNVGDIVETILQIQNFKTKTLKNEPFMKQPTNI